MILIRWIAIVGQIGAITIAQRLFDLELHLGLCYLAVGLAIMGNLISTVAYPENKRLSENENFLMVMFDLLQLCFLLFLTGGLNNPFSLLVLAPVTVSAVALRMRSLVALGAMAFAMTTAMVFFHIPLSTQQGFVLSIPGIFVFGQWAAITIALLFISLYSRRITREMNAMTDALSATQMALARAQKLNDLGGVVAAAAHELGTPLATIKLTSSELIDDLDGQADLQEDARLIREQADRCRDILRSMGRAGKDDLQMRHAPLSEVLREAAEPHMARGKEVIFEEGPGPGGANRQPIVMRKPEVIHGLRNLIQNAVDFAKTTVWIEVGWTEDRVILRILDDGKGFPMHLFGRIGDPFVGRRRQESDTRPDYEGMGLGLFIAKTLLERTGATLSFANGVETAGVSTDRLSKSGAIVEVIWPFDAIAPGPRDRAVLGENTPFV